MSVEQNIDKPQDPAFLQGAVSCRFIYSIYTAYCGVDKEMSKPELWVECKSLKQVGRYLYMTSGQVSYLFNGQNYTQWFGKHGGLKMVKRCRKNGS